MMVRDEVTNPAKNKRHALRGIEKKEICQIKKDNPSIKIAELAKQFECAIPTISEFCQIVTTGLILMKPPPLVHLKEDVKAVFLI